MRHIIHGEAIRYCRPSISTLSRSKEQARAASSAAARAMMLALPSLPPQSFPLIRPAVIAATPTAHHVRKLPVFASYFAMPFIFASPLFYLLLLLLTRPARECATSTLRYADAIAPC